jgi:hypothetical protein
VRLAPEEREVVVTYNDAERSWRVFSDSATMRGRLLRLAQQVGAEVERVGEGVEFTCSSDALRLTAKRRLKLSSEEREARRGRFPGKHTPSPTSRSHYGPLKHSRIPRGVGGS